MSAPGRLRHRVGQAIREGALWRPGERVVVAVSGGLDSMVLLDVLLDIADWHGGRLEVVTVDHGVRPGSADDARFVAAWCEGRVPCHLATLALGDASEARCREARYQVLEGRGAHAIATAHHRDDQAETVLLQLLRGVPPTGMAPRRDRIVRPLLAEPRAALAAWADERALPWREDPTNQSPRYLRNRVRHDLMPLLRELRPGVDGVLVRSAARLAEDLALLDAPAEGPLTLEAARGPWPLVRRRLQHELGLEGPVLEAVRGWLAHPRGALDVGGHRRLTVEAGLLVLR